MLNKKHLVVFKKKKKKTTTNNILNVYDSKHLPRFNYIIPQI